VIDNLTFEIIKRIIADVGAMPGQTGKVGLTDSNLALAKRVVVQYDTATLEHNIYSGKLTLNDTHVMRGLLVDLSTDGHEYIFAFRMDDMPIHVLRADYLDPQESFFRIYNEEKWVMPNTQMKAKVLANFEQFVSWGLLWEECTETGDLYDLVITLI